MADSTTTAPKRAASKSTAAKRTSKPKATAKRPRTAATEASAARSTAASRTRSAARADATAAQATADQGRTIVERAALTYVGAALTARDGVVDAVTDLSGKFGSRTAAEKQLETARRGLERDLKRFERRGTTFRTQVERDARKARTRIERQLRARRRATERDLHAAQRDADRRQNVVTQQLAGVSNRVEGAIQTGLATTERVAGRVQEQVKALA